VDLDGCLVDGSLTPSAAKLVAATPTFTEVSPSGTGLHLWVLGTLARACGAGKAKDIEAYSTGRLICLTGQRYPGTPPDIEPAPRLIAAIDSMMADDGPAPARPRLAPGETPTVKRQMAIPQGARDNSLFRIAAGLVRDGVRGPALVGALAEANARLCAPPLPARDIVRIAHSAERYR
jgi:hypothetical protein